MFVNATSPKQAELEITPHVAVVVYLASLETQYRMRCVLRPIPAATVHASWQLRPDAPKRLDWLYDQTLPQSASVSDREQLLSLLDAVALPDPLVAPDQALGYFLEPLEIERLELDPNRGYADRRRYRQEGGDWVETVLVP